MFRLSNIVTAYHTAHFQDYCLQVYMIRKSGFGGFIFCMFLVQHIIEKFSFEADPSTAS